MKNEPNSESNPSQLEKGFHPRTGTPAPAHAHKAATAAPTKARPAHFLETGHTQLKPAVHVHLHLQAVVLLHQKMINHLYLHDVHVYEHLHPNVDTIACTKAIPTQVH